MTKKLDVDKSPTYDCNLSIKNEYILLPCHNIGETLMTIDPTNQPRKDKPNNPGQVFGYPGDNVDLIEHSQFQDRPFTTVFLLSKSWMEIDYGNKRARVHLADMGMIPYDSGSWNHKTWVTRA